MSKAVWIGWQDLVGKKSEIRVLRLLLCLYHDHLGLPRPHLEHLISRANLQLLALEETTPRVWLE